MNSKLRNSLSKGFTLMELLIVVAIMSSILVALYGTLFPVLGGQKRIERELEKMSELKRFFDIFSMEVQSSFFKKGNPVTVFLGERLDSRGRPISRITFTTFTYPLTRHGHPTGDLMAMRYSVEDAQDGGMALYKKAWNPYIGDEDGGFKAEIIEEIEGFEVSYYNGKEWSKAWDSELEKRPPDAVKVVLAFRDMGVVRELSTIARTIIR
jgi:general secretion pathway protein J